MDTNVGAALVSMYVSGASVLVVYHMFALQGWIQKCETALSEAKGTLAVTTTQDIERLRAERACIAVQKSYPWVQLVAVAGSLAYVTYLTCRVTSRIDDLNAIYLAGPIVVFDGLLALTTVGASWHYLRMLGRTRVQLRGDEHS